MIVSKLAILLFEIGMTLLRSSMSMSTLHVVGADRESQKRATRVFLVAWEIRTNKLVCHCLQRPFAHLIFRHHGYFRKDQSNCAVYSLGVFFVCAESIE